MNLKRIHVFVGVTCVAAVGALVLTDWHGLTRLTPYNIGGFLALVGLGLLSESLAIKLDVGESAGNTSITFIPLLASVQLFGPAAATVLMASTGAFGEFAVRKKDPLRGVFNIAQWIIATTVAGWVFTILGGRAIRGSDLLAAYSLGGQLWPFVSFGLIFLALNHAAVSLAIALSQGLRFRHVWSEMLGHSGATVHDILISPIAIAVAFLYVQFGVTGILIVLLPLLFIRRSYLTTSQLRAANQDLLKALVKAIETRDPYTSGHSLRVSYLARRIAEAMGVPGNAISRIETAALLHDIGKIDSVYSSILLKPAALTPTERSIIQSHVTKGEEVLRTLSSFSADVISAVRHHHERDDVKGYPDGLSGAEIPLGAKIIMVCDAIDAMLSDRPYRDALPLVAVLAELRKNSGSQFSKAVVDAVIDSGILSEFSALMTIRGEAEGESPGSAVGLSYMGPNASPDPPINVRPPRRGRIRRPVS